jgi:hypothetical protein
MALESAVDLEIREKFLDIVEVVRLAIAGAMRFSGGWRAERLVSAG